MKQKGVKNVAIDSSNQYMNMTSITLWIRKKIILKILFFFSVQKLVQADPPYVVSQADHDSHL